MAAGSTQKRRRNLYLGLAIGAAVILWYVLAMFVVLRP